MLRTTRRALVVVGLLGFLARALVPVGLMPAPVSAGGPLVFCHGGAAGAFFRAIAAAPERSADRGAEEYRAGVDHMGEAAQPHAGHGDHHAGHHPGPDQGASTSLDVAVLGSPLGGDGPTAEHLAWENCSFNGAFAHAALAPTFDLPLLALEHTRALPAPRAHSTTATAPRYWARGPPLRTT